MWNYLVKILGTTSAYYDMLMKSRKEHTEITALQISTIADSLKIKALICSYFTQSTNETYKIPVGNNNTWPTDHKLQPLPLIGSFEINGLKLELFVQKEKAIKDNRFQHLNVFKKSDSQKTLSYLAPTVTISESKSLNEFSGTSYPIWEEIVHRFLELNNEIKAIAPDNPWTLYKAAKGKLKSHDYDIQLGGYPQWLINNVDFRNIKKLEFLLEFKLKESVTLFYFYDHDLNKVVMIKQKL
jgi:hypothetical protein